LTDVEIDECTGKKVHVVVKNTPFFVRIGFLQTGVGSDFKIDFRKLTLEAQLLYDCGEEKEVDFIKELPLEYITTFSESGDQIILEVKIKVLTSQLEDMLFILKVTAMDSLTKKNVYPHFYSHPIRVVSKPPRLLKRKAAEAGLQDPSTPQPFKKKKLSAESPRSLGSHRRATRTSKAAHSADHASHGPAQGSGYSKGTELRLFLHRTSVKRTRTDSLLSRLRSITKELPTTPSGISSSFSRREAKTNSRRSPKN